MLTHFQQRFKCPGCEREFVIDVISNGTPHQTFKGGACLECVPKLGGTLLKPGEIKEIPLPPVKPENGDLVNAFKRFKKQRHNTSGID